MFDWRDSRFLSFQPTFIVTLKRLSADSFFKLLNSSHVVPVSMTVHYIKLSKVIFGVSFESVFQAVGLWPRATVCQRPDVLELSAL